MEKTGKEVALTGTGWLKNVELDRVGVVEVSRGTYNPDVSAWLAGSEMEVLMN